MSSNMAWLAGLLALQFSAAQAADTWDTGVTDDGEALYAATVNDSGNLLGQYCVLSSGNCAWLLGMVTGCKEGDSYPVLANSDAGSSHIYVQCSAQLDNGLYRYVFNDFEEIDDLVKKGLRVGFAVPLQGDQFRVVRFDLGGSNRALALMQGALAQANRGRSSRSANTRDQDL